MNYQFIKHGNKVELRHNLDIGTSILVKGSGSEPQWREIPYYYATGGISISTNSLFPSGDRTYANEYLTNPLFCLRIYCTNPPDSHINDTYDKMLEAVDNLINSLQYQRVGTISTRTYLINNNLYNEDGWNRFATVENTKLYYREAFNIAFERIKPLSDNANQVILQPKFYYNGNDYKLVFE